MLGAVLTAAFLYWLLRQMERWLQQHIFKVGWLLTKDFRTTTVLYYVFFLPGVLLHEASLWLAAAFFNVRADRSAQFPVPQESPELRLNFVKVSPRAPKWRLAIIELAPALAGIVVVAIIANGILDITPALTVMRTGSLDDVAAGFRLLTGKPDFWLWTYVLFTVANTMSPRMTSGVSLVRPLLALAAVAAVIVVALGLAQDAVAAVSTAVAQITDVLSAVFGITVVVNAAAIFALAVVENTIERITGDSATIDKHGKLVAKKRAEIAAERLAERQKAMKAREAEKPKAVGATEGIPSIYRLALPLPDSADTAKRVVMAPPEASGSLPPPRHHEPEVIEAKTDVKSAPILDDAADQADAHDTAQSAQSAPIVMPVVQPSTLRPALPPVPQPRQPPIIPSPAAPRAATPAIPPRSGSPAEPAGRGPNELEKMSSLFGSQDDVDEDDDEFDDEDVDDVEPV